ncbi:hypothetical protein JOC48_000409 [Aquibacillus albus]|uniref:Uncharacterized protein n=1 Tax=Aquibacillus albus TaxID=1168171 RepID=A0ABS2MW67_9BACI|nr:hypothetical protein [Aquibacillus albus]
MFPETIPSILLHASWLPGHGCGAQVDSAEGKLDYTEQRRYQAHRLTGSTYI